MPLELDLLLAYERNGEPLEHRNGAPLRLIVPGWYGVANVKWLSRIECRNRRYMGRYMARDYVTVRGERHGDEIVYVETSVTRINLKSVVARVTRKPTVDGQVPVKAFGAAWDDGTGIAKVQVKVDDGQWRDATLAAGTRLASTLGPSFRSTWAGLLPANTASYRARSTSTVACNRRPMTTRSL